jgi:hypothetical protein
MNTNLLAAIKQLVAQQGEAILADSKQANALLSAMAANEPKPQRMAFVRCLMYGFQTELKNTQAPGRAACKNRLAKKLSDEEGMDLSLANDTLDLLEMILFGTVSDTPKPAPRPVPQPAPIPAAPPPKPAPAPIPVNVPVTNPPPAPPPPPQYPPIPPNPTGEIITYEGNGVLVSTTRFVSLGKTYAMSNISSVGMSCITNKNRKKLQMYRIICGIAAIPSYFIAQLFGPLIAIAACIFLTMDINKCKDTYIIKLTSISGETDELSSEDGEFIGSVVDAINNALIQRG